MEKLGKKQATVALRKEKKKQVQGEIDRLKQAEKKRRRLEKALATSAAIRSELEKKKQKKREEQERLCEEGAALAESVALHVLLGEDADESCQIMLGNDKRFGCFDHPHKLGFFMDHYSFEKQSHGGLGRTSNSYGSGYEWNDWVNGVSSLRITDNSQNLSPGQKHCRYSSYY
ncbi:hypothetical protein AXF42_Ash008486 [Apostasia shenzhenica]|uniref:Uncharacterized protein n=1 Tax=Apostasia shenzhenica TaxID=1088818 RepID=A0A2I0AY24_9ASPA|nr:hypothetical protein AXF42_Ash008486 [Apostasia shenzhenica]